MDSATVREQACYPAGSVLIVRYCGHLYIGAATGLTLRRSSCIHMFRDALGGHVGGGRCLMWPSSRVPGMLLWQHEPPGGLSDDSLRD